MKVYFDFNDWWIGYYRGSNYHFICPLPTVVIRWGRRKGKRNPFEPFWATVGGPGSSEWMCTDCGRPEHPFSPDDSWMCSRHRAKKNI